MPFNLSVSIATCVLILGLGFNSIDPVSVQGQEQTPTYLDPDGRFSIKYPVDAEVRTGESDVIAVSFEARDSTPTSTSVIILNNTDTKDLDVIVEDVISSTNSTGNFTFISPTCAKWTLSGYEACGIAYNAAPSATPGSSQLGPNDERIRQVISNVGDKVYIIELRTDSSHVNTHKDVFNAIVHSFQVPGDSGQLTPKIGTSSSGEIRLPTSTGPITYTDPSGFYTLQHPSGWEIEYEEPVTRFDEPTTTITVKPGLGSIVIISVLHNQDNIDEDIGDLALSLFSRNYE
ncbi:MAG: PsbP-related protein, partial [Nitrososphaeraceae archaeon]